MIPALLERDEESPIFGPLRLRELTRAQYRQCSREADCSLILHLPDGKGGIQDVPITTDQDKWHGGVFACGTINPETGERLLTSTDAVLELPQRDDVWTEITRLAKLILQLSEAGQAAPAALKSRRSKSNH